MIDAHRRQLQACEGELASLLATVNRDCLGSVFDKSPERQARAVQLFNLVGDRGQVLNLLAALRGLSWLWRVNLAERRATIWMRTVSRRADDARHLIVAGTFYAGG